jgi:hypothetical protein
MSTTKFSLLYRACISKQIEAGESVVPFWINNFAYHPVVAEVIAWIIENTPCAKISFEQYNIFVMFDNDSDAAAFRLRWC